MNENERPWVTDIKADGNVRFERVHNVGVDEANSWYVLVLCLFFFVQAEDGIRDLTVTGVQTCALPILSGRSLMSALCPVNSHTILAQSITRMRSIVPRLIAVPSLIFSPARIVPSTMSSM